MRYIFDVPERVGHIGSQTNLNEIEVTAISFNFEPRYSDQGKINMSIVLKDRATDHALNVVYFNDESAHVFWNEMNDRHGIVQQVLEKLAKDGKLPPGKIAPLEQRPVKPATAHPVVVK